MLVAAIVIAYAAIALALTLSKRPWQDEASFHDSAVHLLADGSLRTPIEGIHGGRYEGLDRRTYWMPPLNFVAQAAWYALLGPGIVTMRLLSVLFGSLALAAWFGAVRRLLRDDGAALVATTLLACDYVFLMAASDGRMDMMATALGVSAISAYLALREHSVPAALLAGNSLVAASMLTHPNGVLYLFMLVVLTWYLDRRNLQRELWIAAVPYLVGGAAWGAYIAQDPHLFAVQFFGNMHGRLGGFAAPWWGFAREVRERYLEFYGLGPGWSLTGRGRSLILAVFVLGIGSAIRPAREGETGTRALLLMLGVCFGTMAIVQGSKTPIYLIYIMPLLTATVAAASAHHWRARTVPRAAVAGMLVVLCGVQLTLAGRKIAQYGYRNSFMPAVQAVRRVIPASGLVLGCPEFAFGLGFDGTVIDDPRLGYFSRRRPDAVVMDSRYRAWLDDHSRAEPEVSAYVQHLLTCEMRPVFTNDLYEVFARPAAAGPGVSAPECAGSRQGPRAASR
ncbi:MAG: glycosyltransferase family 39 protein [Gemmatimonadales bacterium]